MDNKDIRDAVQKIYSMLSTPKTLADPTFTSLKVEIGKYPVHKDLAPIELFLNIFRMKKIRSGGRIIEYRYFFEHQNSLHIIILKKKYGFTITCHLDVGIHEQAQNTLLSSTLLTGLSLVLTKAYPQLKRVESQHESCITLIDEISRKKAVKDEITEVFTNNLNSIIIKLAKSSLKSPISESNLIKEITPIIGQYLNTNDPDVSNILPDILKAYFKKISEKVLVIRKNIQLRNERLKNRQIKVEPFEWRKSNENIPVVVKNFIKKRVRFGNKCQTISGSMIPKSLIKKGIVEFTFTITEDDIIVSGYRSKERRTLKIKSKSFICPYCSQSFETKSKRSSHLKTVHNNELKRTTTLSLVRKYLQTSSNDYRNIDKIKDHLKKYIKIVKLCNSCSKPIELSDYYIEHYNPDSIEKLIKKWNAKNSWVLCPKCEKEKNMIKKHLI